MNETGLNNSGRIVQVEQSELKNLELNSPTTKNNNQKDDISSVVEESPVPLGRRNFMVDKSSVPFALYGSMLEAKRVTK